ncbi:MAG: DNA mismatch repair protein MutS [Lachnospiraceae bacterium]|nr:DNA mismatch repair protein MutS [Lachnospiraceae bacterium]
MMQQYMETKKEYPDCILFYRLGDFYEMFYEDALTASKVLEITLTGKNCGLEEKAPMCGVPYHAVDTYLNKMVSSGYKVAICEQMEDPATTKGIVRREVIRIVTPGTNLNMQALEEGKNNYIMSVVYFPDKIGVSFADVTTGEYRLTEMNDTKRLMDEIAKLLPVEIICNDAFMVSDIDMDTLKNRLGITVYNIDSWYFEEASCQKSLQEHFHISSIKGLGIDDFATGMIAAGALMQYLYETQKISLSHITRLDPYINSKYMLLDSSTRRNLELCETMREKQKRGTLLWILDKTKTAMGARMLRSYIEQPLIRLEEIILRQNAVSALCKAPMERDEIREYLGAVYDLERLLAKISYKSVNPRDMIAFRNSLKMLPFIRLLLEKFEDTLLHTIYEEIDALEDICQKIEAAIVEEPPISTRDGGIIKEGYDPDIDQLRSAKTKGKTWLAEMEATERERTGIKNLRIKYNKVFGYYLEVTNSYKNLVPEDYTRKQTLANAERYTTPRLKELEDMILNAEDKLYALEYDAFAALRDEIDQNLNRVQKTARAVAQLDVYASLSFVAERNHYVCPLVNTKGIINIKGGRHPVVEKMIENDMFIDNDTFLDNKKNCISIITGPNMAGKSTYMRQVALIVLMAQVGSFVPAKSAEIGIVDRIFTRVGASDDLASGQSTFMIEMNEVANILRNATADSLLILDEIGRGTSTFDGLSIAWAVIEHISNKKLLGAKTLFATHYHELTELEGRMNNVNNYCIAVKEKGDDIVFLRKIVRGGADKSYGIQVAKLAGVPDMVIDRAKEIVGQLSDNDIIEKIQTIAGEQKSERKSPMHYEEVDLEQMSLFDTVTDQDIIEELKGLDISNMTPLDAMNTLYGLQNKLKNRW